eukprot:403360583
MIYPSFVSSYQNYNQSKKERLVDGFTKDQTKQTVFEIFRSNLNNFSDLITNHKMPLTMPINQGMLQAFGQPTSRQQVEILINWFDETLQNLIHFTLDNSKLNQQIYKASGNNLEGQDSPNSNLISQDNNFQKEYLTQQQNSNSRSHRIQDLLDFTLNELIKQVTIQCQERGFLLQKVLDMILGIERDSIALLKNEKQRIFLKAQSQITILKENQETQIQSIEQTNQERIEKLDKLELINKELNLKILKLEEVLDETKFKKRKLQRMNNHLIDSLVIKANQLKLANRQFKFKVTNQIEDFEKQSVANQSHLGSQKIKVVNMDQQKLSARAVEGIQKKILTSRRGSRLFRPTEDKELTKLQQELKTRIAKRVKKILESSNIESDEGELNIKLDGFNPSGNVNSGISYLEQNLNNQKKVEKEDAENNIKKLMKVKLKLQNLAEEPNLNDSQGNLSHLDFSQAHKKSLFKANQFLQIKARNNDPTTPSIQIQNLQQNQSFNSNDPIIRLNTHNVQLNQVNLDQQSAFRSIGQDMTPISRIIDADRSSRSGSNSKSKSLDSSLSYDDKSMQFPENDVLNESDFKSLILEAEDRIILVQEGQVKELEDQEKRYRRKFVKTQDEINPDKKMVIDMNLDGQQSDLNANSDYEDGKKIDGQHEAEDFLLVDLDSSDEEDSDQQYRTLSDKHQLTQEQIDQQKMTPGQILKQQEQAKRQKEKEQMKNFLDGNDDQHIQNLQHEDFGMQHEIIEENQQYEQIDDKNKMFYDQQQQMIQANPELLQSSTNQDAFKGKVNTIVSMILDNLKSNKLSKKQLLKLVVSNVLKNEQDEIKHLVIDQIFGQTTDNTKDILSGLPKSALASLNKNDSPLGALRQQNQEINQLHQQNKDLQNFKLPTYLYSKYRDESCQTDTLWMIDFLDCGINPAEIYKFDNKADKLYKYTFNRDAEQDIVKQQEFIMKHDAFADLSIDKKHKPNPFMEKLKEQAKSSKFEIERSNIILKELLSKIRELEEYVCTLEERKTQLEDQMNKNFKVKDRFIQQFDLWVNSWHRGFVIGFYRGMSSGYFKGAVESKDYGIQEGYQLGIKDGWQFGFDDGFKNGVRKIYQEAKDKGLDVNLLNTSLNIYLSQSEKRQGIQQYIQNKIFKISPFRAIGPVVRLIIEKFNAYNDMKKKHFAKLGLKTVIKMIRQYYASKSHNKDYLLTEFVFDECQKKFGHNKMAKRAFIQFIASSYYHMNMHTKINQFCSFMHINDKPYSNEVTTFYVQVLDALQNSNIGLKSDYDEKTDKEYISLTKSIEVMKEKLETMLPGEIILDLRQRIEKLKIKGQKTKQSSIDLDKYMDFMLRSFIKFHVDLSNKPQLVYFSYTLYEGNQISFNELSLMLEVLGGNTLKMINELREHIEIQKKDLLKLFAEGCQEEEKIVIRFVQYHEIIKDSDIFTTKAAREIFAKLPFRGTIQKFQEAFDIQAQELKNLVNELFNNQDIIDRMENMDGKDYWYNRIYAIERNIGEVNSTLLYLSLIMVTETLKYLKQYKGRIIRLIWEEKHGTKAPDDIDLEQLMNQQVVGQFQEKVIKQQISSKVEEITTNASPTLINSNKQSTYGKKSITYQ